MMTSQQIQYDKIFISIGLVLSDRDAPIIDNALADYRSADNRCQTIGRLPINTKTSRNRTKARSSHCI